MKVYKRQSEEKIAIYFAVYASDNVVVLCCIVSSRCWMVNKEYWHCSGMCSAAQSTFHSGKWWIIAPLTFCNGIKNKNVVVSSSNMKSLSWSETWWCWVKFFSAMHTWNVSNLMLENSLNKTEIYQIKSAKQIWIAWVEWWIAGGIEDFSVSVSFVLFNISHFTTLLLSSIHKTRDFLRQVFMWKKKFPTQLV